MKPTDIKVGKTYQGGKRGQRRRVKKIFPTGVGAFHQRVEYNLLEEPLKTFGATHSSGMLPFAKWATEEVTE